MRDGWLSTDAMVSVPVVIEERSAVVIGATSLDEQDLLLRLVGDGVDLASDDAYSEPGVFSFEQQTRDPALAAVLDPGTYELEIEEWAGEATEFQLQMLTGSQSLVLGEVADLALDAAVPTVIIVPADASEITAISDVDTVLWAYSEADDMWLTDDDSAGDRNPRIEFGATIGGAMPALIVGYERDVSGGVQVMVE